MKSPNNNNNNNNNNNKTFIQRHKSVDAEALLITALQISTANIQLLIIACNLTSLHDKKHHHH